MTLIRALEDSKTLYRTDNPTAILVQDVTKMAGSGEPRPSEAERADLDESSRRR